MTKTNGSLCISYLYLLQECKKCAIRNSFEINIPAGNYMFKVNNRNTEARCETCSKLTMKTPEQRQWRRFGVFIVNFEHISHFVIVFLLLTLNS